LRHSGKKRVTVGRREVGSAKLAGQPDHRMALVERNGPSSMDGAPEGDAGPATGPRPAGEALRRQRQALGLDLQDVAAALRIKPRHLAAIEAGRPEQLPGLVYALGFTRSYADYLGLDPGEVLRRFKEGPIGLPEHPDLSFPMPPGERSMRDIAALLTAICGYGMWYYLSSGEGRSVERVAPVPAELLAHTMPAPPAFGTSSPADRAGMGSAPAGPPAASAAPVLPAARDVTQPRKGRPIHRVDPRQRGSRN
jgi:transcriptional regulator with XRE-family HTH domain